MQERADPLVGLADAIEVCLGDLDGADLAGAQQVTEGDGGGGGELLRHGYDSSLTMRGTWKRPSSARGAVEIASSGVSEARGTSSRSTLVSAKACPVGGTSAAATSPTFSA